MSRNEPDDERVARALLAEVLGVPVDRHDDGSSPGMFDFEFELVGGRRGAAEMTTIADERSRSWHAQRRNEPRIAGSKLQWIVRRRGHSIRFDEVMRHLEAVVPLLEARGVRDPRDLPATDPLGANESVLWIRRSGIQVQGFTASLEHQGRVYPELDTAGSFIADTLDQAVEWLEAELAGSRYNNKFEKLSRSGRAEQHLVLRIDIHGIPNDHYFALTNDAATLPKRPPAAIGRWLTGLWLLPEFATSIVWWSEIRGWQRHALRAPD